MKHHKVGYLHLQFADGSNPYIHYRLKDTVGLQRELKRWRRHHTLKLIERNKAHYSWRS